MEAKKRINWPAVILQTILYWTWQGFDALFSGILLLTRRDPYKITEEKLAEIKRISLIANPEEGREYAEAQDVREALSGVFHCRKGKLYVLNGDDWYMIIMRGYVRFLVTGFYSVTGKCPDILRIYRELITVFRGKKAVMNCAADTSYPLVMTLAGRGMLKILRDIPQVRDDKDYHRIILRVRRRPARKKPVKAKA